MRRPHTCLLASLLTWLAALTPLWAADKPLDPDEWALKRAGLAADGPKLVDYLGSISCEDVSPQRIDQLIRDFASRDFDKREQAQKELLKVGLPALAALRRAARNTDAEVARRAQACIQEITKPEAVEGLKLAVVRTLVRLKPPGALQALIRFLPCIGPDEALEEEIWYGLDALAVAHGKIDPALLVVLKNPDPARRAVAACIVGHRGSKEQQAEVRKLLADPDAMVRLRAAQGLLATKDKAAILILIELLKEPAVAICWQAEELLHWVAGDDAPSPTIGAGTAKEQENCRQAWQAWWREHGDKVDLAKLDQEPRRPGLLLLCSTFYDGTPSPIWLCGCDGTSRWQLNTLRNVSDVRLLPDGWLLVAQFSQEHYVRVDGGAPRWVRDPIVGVTERDLSGNVLWQYKGVPSPGASRRRPNGNTLIAALNAVEEVTPEGKPVFSRQAERGEGGFSTGYPFILDNGHLFYGQATGGKASGLGEVDPITAKDLGRVSPQAATPPLNVSAATLQTVPNGHYLITAMKERLVVELDGGWKKVWEYRIDGSYATRLRNGNTLISCQTYPANRVVEIDHSGRMVWEVPAQTTHQPHVCLRLVRFGFDAPYPADLDLASVPYRIKRLSSKDAGVRILCAVALEELGPKAGAAVPALLGALEGADQKLRKAVTEALQKILSPKTLPGLLKAARDERPEVRAGAVGLIQTFREQPDAVVSTLLDALRDENPLVRRNAAWAMGAFGSDGRVVRALIEALKDKDVATDPRDSSVAEWAAISLGQAKVELKAAVAALLEATQSGNELRANKALRALGYIGRGDKTAAQSIVPALAAILKDKRRRTLHIEAAFALANIGPEASPAVPALRQALREDRDTHSELVKGIRGNVLYALSRIGPNAKDAVPDLIAVLENKKLDHSERQDAAKALGNIGPQATCAVSVLTKALEDRKEDLAVREAARKALEMIRR